MSQKLAASVCKDVWQIQYQNIISHWGLQVCKDFYKIWSYNPCFRNKQCQCAKKITERIDGHNLTILCSNGQQRHGAKMFDKYNITNTTSPKVEVQACKDISRSGAQRRLENTKLQLSCSRSLKRKCAKILGKYEIKYHASAVSSVSFRRILKNTYFDIMFENLAVSVRKDFAKKDTALLCLRT